MSCEENGRGPGRFRLDLKSALLVLAFIGAAVSVELTIVHQRAYQNRRSGCDISAHVSCSKVARTPQSEVLGVPVSVWGFCSYAAFAFLAIWAMACPEHKQWPWGIVFVMALAAVLYSVYLGYVAYGKYKLVCLWCTALYGVNLGMLLVAALALWRAGTSPWAAVAADVAALVGRPVVTASLGGIAVMVAVGLVIFFPKPKRGLAAAKVDIASRVTVEPSQGAGSLPGKAVVLSASGIPAALRDLVSPDTPSRGPLKADLYVVELSDYECPFCGAAHKVLRKAFAKYSGRIRIFHRQFPLDRECNPLLKRPFHPHSCAAARAAICAQEQGKFWRMHDLLFAYPRNHDAAGLRRLAEQAGLDLGLFESCMQAPRTRSRLLRDINLGIRLKLRGTPTFFLWGPHLKRTKIPGMISLSLFDNLFATLARKVQSPRKETLDHRGDHIEQRAGSPAANVPSGGSPTRSH